MVSGPSLRTLWRRLTDVGVILPDMVRLETFLKEHPDMLGLIGELCEAARAEFGRPDELCLEVYVDPEDEERSLVLYVRQNEYADDIMARIESVRSAFCEDLARVSGGLHLTTDFAPPRQSIEE